VFQSLFFDQIKSGFQIQHYIMKRNSYKKAFLLCSSKYSLYHTLESILLEFCDEVIGMNVLKHVRNIEISINTQMFRMPYSIRNKWTSYYQNKINAALMKEFRLQSPELVFIYNNEMLLPSSVAEIRKSAEVIFFLGDSPYYTPTNDYFLTLLNMGDMVLVPDSFWMQQMRALGIKNTFLFIPGIDENSYHQHPPQELTQALPETDILYCGMSYLNSWGYKKAMLMSKFTDFNLEIYGNRAWKRWFQFFPKLSSVFHESGFIQTPLLNAMFNKTKLMPVDGNPAILNGFHLRTFEALGAGVLPLIEQRKDVEDEIFTNIDIQLPIIRSYDDATQLAEKFLSDETLRVSTVGIMKKMVLNKYSTERNAERILEFLDNSKGK
jgi:hypothetical protein